MKRDYKPSFKVLEIMDRHTVGITCKSDKNAAERKLLKAQSELIKHHFEQMSEEAQARARKSLLFIRDRINELEIERFGRCR